VDCLARLRGAGDPRLVGHAVRFVAGLYLVGASSGCIPREDVDLPPDLPVAVAPSPPSLDAFAFRPRGPAPVPAPGAFNAVAYAYSRIGTPYCWGGAGPNCFDCSGLTRAAWLTGGKSIPRTSSDQAAKLPKLPIESAMPGDILWRPGHVGIYVGNGLAIAAIGRGDVVRFQPAGHFVGAVRP
jgi:cell wall-associated NlpC family hydrolase